METIEYIRINIALEMTCFVLTAALLLSMLLSKQSKTRQARLLLCMLAVQCAVLASDAVAWLFAGRARPAVVISNFVLYVFANMQALFSTLYVYTYVSNRYPDASKKLVHGMIVIACIAIGLSIATQFTGWLYSFDENNLFVYGSWNGVYQFYAIAVHLANIAFLLWYRKHLDGRDMRVLLLFLLLPIIGMIMEALLVYFMVVYILESVALVVLYVSLQVQQEIEAAEKEASLKASVMLSQIQPHFIYNTLGAIDRLCYESPDDAHNAIITFSKYLRSNMDSLTQKELIPFAKELEHTMQYLRLEQYRFEERVQLEMDIKTEHFSLPVLTLQPIVENAVRYGITKQASGGTLRIATEETDACYRITVADDGVGFDPDVLPQDGRSHMGIVNVRSRLAAMCGGRLLIHSTPGEGTTAIIEIPRAEGKR